jgi:hypothetical protein
MALVKNDFISSELSVRIRKANKQRNGADFEWAG